MTLDQASTPALYPSRERLVRIAAMIRDAERSSPVLAARKRGARNAGLIALPVRRRAARRPQGGAVPLAS